jgi:ABC-type multidrug transport system ATPase subunit
MTKLKSLWLELDHITMSYGQNVVLKDLSFSLAKATIMGIVGENGAGKSTLLKIIVGLLKPVHGTVLMHGRFGYCPQEAELFLDLTPFEHYRYFAAAYDLATVDNAHYFQNLCERYQLTRFMHIRVQHLSAGTRQKLNLVLALIHQPEVLILDEPYSGFDWESYTIFWQHTKELTKTNTSILVVSHLIHDQTHLDSLLQLKEGFLS